MPQVGKKHFPYTKKGQMMAKEMGEHMGKPVINKKPKAKKGKRGKRG